MIETAVRDLINAMKQGKDNHCIESYADINNCRDIKDLVELLIKYRLQLIDMDVPTSAFMQKHFSEPKLLDELNKLGIYINQSITIDSPLPFVFLFGDCKIQVTTINTKSYVFILSGNSFLDLNARGFSMNHIVLKGKATCTTKKENYAHIRIKDNTK